LLNSIKTIIQTLSITKASYLNGYKLRLQFSDGHVNTIDFEKFLTKAKNPMITKYGNLDLFSKFEIDDGDLMWNDFEMSFSLEDIYDRSEM